MKPEEKYMQFKALIDAMSQLSPMHFKAYTDYMKMTDGDEELSRTLARDLITALLSIRPREEE